MKNKLLAIMILLSIILTACQAKNQELKEVQEEIIPETETIQDLPETQDIDSNEAELSIGEKHWEKVFERAFRQIDCPEPTKRNLPESYYQGPMIDTHMHIISLPDGMPLSQEDYYTTDNIGAKRSITEWVCMMDYEGTNKAFAFFPVWGPIIQQSLDFINKTLEKYPDRFIPFIMPPDNDGSQSGFPTVDAEILQDMLKPYPGLFKGYGEIGLYSRPNGAPALPPDSKRLTEIYPVIRNNKLIVYFHLGEDQKESFEKALSENPDITFIWHGDQLIECETCDKTLNDVAGILEKHPNVYYGIDELYGNVWLLQPKFTRGQFIAHFADYKPLLEKDIATWKYFIEKHPDQVIWGTDRGVSAPWDLDLEVALALNNYTRAFIGKLNPAVQEKFAYRNAEKILSGQA